MSTNFIQFYHFFLRLFGIRIKLLDFDCNEINEKSSVLFKRRFFKWISVIVFLMFIVCFPIFVKNILARSRVFGNKKKLEYFVAIVNFYLRFVTVIVIFTAEFAYEKKATIYQNAIKLDLMQLQYVYPRWFVHLKGRAFKSKNWPEALANLIKPKNYQVLFIILIIIFYNIINALRFISQTADLGISRFFSVILINIPNLCITLFILHVSEMCAQYTKLYRFLNQLVAVIANDINNKLLSVRTKKHNRFKSSVVATMNEQKLNTAVNHLAAVMDCHNKLKINILNIRTFFIMQSSIVTLNCYISIIIQVRTIF